MTTEDTRHVQRCCLAVPPFHADNCVNSPSRRIPVSAISTSTPVIGHVEPMSSLLFDDLGAMVPPKPINAPTAETSLQRILRELAGEVPQDTAGRMLRALQELTEGYKTTDLEALCKTFEPPNDPGVVVVSGMPFASLCEHHVLPFTGVASVAYIPTSKIIGLSKIPRLLRAITRRLQVQERIGSTMADTLMSALAPRGVMVIVRARHTCMAIRGAESSGEMVTSCVRGVFATDAAARAEGMALLNRGG